MALESFMGTALDDIINDYLMSFNSIFESSIFAESQKADALVVMQILSVMGDSLVINNQNLQSVAENYLRNTVKLSAKEVELLNRKLAGIKSNVEIL